MKSNMITIAFLTLSIGSLLASEKQQVEEASGGMKRAREMTPHDDSSSRLTRLNHFLCFPNLLPELQETIIREFICQSLYACNAVEDYKKLKLCSSMTTSKHFCKVAYRTLQRNSELRYRYEIAKLVEKLKIAEQNKSIHQWFGSECPDSDPATCKWRPRRKSDYCEWFKSEDFGLDRKIDFEQALKILNDYIHADATLVTENQRFALLRDAAYFKHYPMLVQLITKCAEYYVAHQDTIDSNASDANGTLLCWACGFGCEKAVDLLLSIRGIDKNKYNPLAAACYSAMLKEWGDAESIRNCVRKLLLFSEVHINAVDKFGFTPLMYASLSGDVELVKMLLARSDIDVNVRDEDGWTALMEAIHFGWENVVKELLQYPGIDTDGSVFAATRYGQWNIVKMLREVPHINVNFQISNVTALMEALKFDCSGIDRVFFAIKWEFPTEVEKIDLEKLRLLLSFPGMDVNILGGNGFNYTALMAAVENREIELVREILPECTVDGLNAQEEGENHTALIKAVLDKSDDIVQLLLEIPELDVNLVSNDGTALMVAARDGNIEIVKMLLARGDIDIDVIDADENALTLAILNRHQEICALLRARGATIPAKESPDGGDQPDGDSQELED